MEPIKRRGFAQPDRAAAEASVAAAVETDPEPFIQAYLADYRSFGGRYIAADLFKETFEVYRESKDSRNRYNTPVHNTAAVLAAEMFRRMLADQAHSDRNNVLFLTGIPGAGKTSSIVANKEKLHESIRVVFEGQLSNLETTKEKIQQVLDAGLAPAILVVHVTPEVALDNVITRYYEEGRGASINVMSEIQGRLPDTLAAVHQLFGEEVELFVQDNRDRQNPKQVTGWSQLAILRSEGNHDEIKRRLHASLDCRHAAGAVSPCCHQQAIGGVPVQRDEQLDVVYQREHETYGDRRGISQGNSAPPQLSDSVSSARRKDQP